MNVFTVPYVDIVANHGRWPGRVGNYLPLGRPIVSNPVGEMKWLISQNDLGLLADEDPDDFAEKILSLLADRSLAERLGNNARKTAVEKLTWLRMTDELERCYMESCARFADA